MNLTRTLQNLHEKPEGRAAHQRAGHNNRNFQKVSEGNCGHVDLLIQ